MIYELHEDSETSQFGNLELDEEYDHVHCCSQCRFVNKLRLNVDLHHLL